MTSERSVRVRLVAGSLVVLVAIVAVLGAWQVMAARSSQQRQIEKGEVTAARLASSALSSALATQVELISNLAKQPQLATVFTPSKGTQLTDLTAALHLLYPAFSSFDVIAADGTLLGRWPSSPKTAGSDVSSNGSFAGVMRTGRPYISDGMQQAAAPYQLVVGIAAPVRNAAGQIVGILQGTLPASSLGSMIGGTALGDGNQLVIVDQAGHVLSGPGAGVTHTYRSSPVVQKSLQGNTGSARGPVPGSNGTRLAGYAPVPSTGWAVIAEEPLTTLQSSLTGLTERLVAIGLLVVAFAIASLVLIGGLVRRLTRERQQAGALLACLGEGVATIDRSGRAISVNPAMASLRGRPIAQLSERPWSEALAVTNEDGSPVPWEESTAFAAIQEQRVVVSNGYELSVAGPDGRRTPIALTAAPLRVGNDLLGAVVVVRDVAHEHEVDELKSSLVSTVSHELRTPLTMIQGFSELLLTRDDLGPARARQALEQVHNSAIRLGRLIDDLLSVSRIDSGKVTTDLGPVELGGVVAEVERIFVEHTDCRLVSEIELGLPRVLADRDKMVQVVTNLVSNAVKYSPKESPVRIVARTVDGRAELSVIDEGIGMSDAECAHIFEKFSRSDRPEVRDVGGTGLGLYITKNLVELQHGQLWVRSVPGEGSVFSVSLPFADGAPTIDDAPAGEPAPDRRRPNLAKAAHR